MGIDGVCFLWLLVYVENNEIVCVYVCKSLVSHTITKLTFSDIRIFLLYFFLIHKETMALFLHLQSPVLSPLYPLRILVLNYLSYTWWALLVLPDTQRPKVFFRVYKGHVNANSILMILRHSRTQLQQHHSVHHWNEVLGSFKCSWIE